MLPVAAAIVIAGVGVAEGGSRYITGRGILGNLNEAMAGVNEGLTGNRSAPLDNAPRWLTGENNVREKTEAFLDRVNEKLGTNR